MSEIPIFWGRKFVPKTLSRKRSDGRRWWVRLFFVSLCLGIILPSVIIPSYQRYRIIKTSIRSLFGTNVDWNNPYIEIAEKALKRLPQDHLTSLEHVSINVHTADKTRGKANSAQLIINAEGLPVEEFLSVFIHEMGHVVDLGSLRSIGFEPTAFRNTKVGDLSLDFYTISWDASQIQKKAARKEDFVSDYAQENAYEDFAESYLFYVLHGKEFRKRAETNAVLQKKYDFFQQFVFDGHEYDFTQPNYEYPAHFFDTTLLPYNFWRFFELSPKTNEIVKKEPI
ncbi:hypothetical protein CSB37_03225 [bacterium DOLZORAL124_38_8]|nr:MAG: hypothetical protein CSB37_03225 [bacterium DOLZORAL124_38_8]